MIIFDQLNRNFCRRCSALNRVCCCKMFHCCCIPGCPTRSKGEHHLSLLLFVWRTKGYWSVGFMSLGKQTCHWIVTHKFLANVKFLSTQRADVCIVTKFHWLVIFIKQHLKLMQQPQKSSKKAIDLQMSLSIVITTVRSRPECLSTCAFPEVPNLSRAANYPWTLRVESSCSTP